MEKTGTMLRAEQREIRKKAATLAMGVQNASNLTGVLNSMLEVARELKTLPECTGTGWINTHPAMQLFASKIHSLAQMGLSGEDEFARAYRACRIAARGE